MSWLRGRGSIVSETQPTIKAVLKHYQLYWHPYVKRVVVYFKDLPNQAPRFVTREEAERVLSRPGLDVHGNLLYTEIMSMYKENL